MPDGLMNMVLFSADAVSMIGAGEGTSLDQLKLMRAMAKRQGLQVKNLSNLINNFERVDDDRDGKVNTDEFEDFARKKDIGLSKKDQEDDAAVENALVQRAITAYTANEKSSVAFLVNLFVADA